MAVATRNQKAL